MQNRQGETTTLHEAIFYGTFPIVFICFLIFCLPEYLIANTLPKDQGQENELRKIVELLMLILSFLCLLLFLNVPPNIGNTLRYKETKNAYKDWLTQKLDQKDFKKIEKLVYNREGFFKINELLNKKKISRALPENIPGRYQGL